jgi:hypothetical protein
MSLALVFNSATGTGVDQSPNLSGCRTDAAGAAMIDAIRQSSVRDCLMIPPLNQ